MGESFGYFSPRLLAELAEQSEQLSQVGRDLDSYEGAWTAALRSLNRENLRRFLDENPQWNSRLGKEALDSLRDGDRRLLTRELLKELADYVRKNSEIATRIALLREKAEATSTGVPFLHSIPVVGSLFGTDIEGDERTELLVIITPRALYNESELREVSEEMRKQIRHMELLEKPPI